MCSCSYKEHTTGIQKGDLIPNFNILLLDSSTRFNTSDIPYGKDIILMYFSPDCHYCQEETKDLIKHINDLKNVLLYMCSGSSLKEIKDFSEYYQLANYPNIITGRDYSFSFINYYKPTSIPFMALYNKKKQLDKIFLGAVTVNDIYQEIEN